MRSTRRKKGNPLSSLLYPGVHLPEGHSIPWHPEAHKRIRAAVNRIDLAKTHDAMGKAYNDARKVVESLNKKGLGAGRGYPHEWFNDIGSSYVAKYKELGPTEEDKRERMMAEARKLEKERKARKRKNPTDAELINRSLTSGKGHADVDDRGYVLYFGGKEYIIGDVTAEKAYKKIMELTEKGDEGSFARRMHRNNPGGRSRSFSPRLRQRMPTRNNPLSVVDAALHPYGASLTPEGFIQKGGKVLSVRVVLQGKKLRMEGNGKLLASGAISAKFVQDFVERFWYWKKVT